MDLLLLYVAIDNRASPSLIQITLYNQKGPVYKRCTNILGKYYSRSMFSTCSGTIPCQAGWYSRTAFQTAKWLTRGSFSTAFNEALEIQQMDSSQCIFHSFRIGTATSAKQASFSDSYLKALGTWRSDAYQKYVRLSPQDLARLSKSLAYTQRMKLT